MKAEKIKERRKELEWAQWVLAKEVGVSEKTIRLWEQGVTTPNEENMKKLEEVLK